MSTPRVRALYAYAFTTDDGLELDGVPGVDGGSPRLIRRDGVGLVVSEVALSRLDQVPTEEVTEESPIAALIRTHDAVVRAIAAQAPVLPLRFGTVITDDDAAASLLEQRRDDARQMLDHVAGHREWGVRLRLVDPSAEQNPAGSHVGGGSATSPVGDTATSSADPSRPGDADASVNGRKPSGMEYLARRRKARQEKERASQRRNALVDEAHEALAGYAKDAVLRSPRIAGTLSDAAYLVSPEREAEFFAEAEKLAGPLGAEGIVAEATGPWPPYSFVRADAEVGA